MRIGYVRVSTIEQHEDRQIIELKEKAKYLSPVERFISYTSRLKIFTTCIAIKKQIKSMKNMMKLHG